MLDTLVDLQTSLTTAIAFYSLDVALILVSIFWCTLIVLVFYWVGRAVVYIGSCLLDMGKDLLGYRID